MNYNEHITELFFNFFVADISLIDKDFGFRYPGKENRFEVFDTTAITIAKIVKENKPSREITQFFQSLEKELVPFAELWHLIGHVPKKFTKNKNKSLMNAFKELVFRYKSPETLNSAIKLSYIHPFLA